MFMNRETAFICEPISGLWRRLGFLVVGIRILLSSHHSFIHTHHPSHAPTESTESSTAAVQNSFTVLYCTSPPSAEGPAHRLDSPQVTHRHHGMSTTSGWIKGALQHTIEQKSQLYFCCMSPSGVPRTAPNCRLLLLLLPPPPPPPPPPGRLLACRHRCQADADSCPRIRNAVPPLEPELMSHFQHNRFEKVLRPHNKFARPPPAHPPPNSDFVHSTPHPPYAQLARLSLLFDQALMTNKPLKQEKLSTFYSDALDWQIFRASQLPAPGEYASHPPSTPTPTFSMAAIDFF
jgi:hypothetical protein